jgi:hypothetical protein
MYTPSAMRQRAYRRAVDVRHHAATVGARSEVEQRATERAWLKTFQDFCHRKDHGGETALDVAVHHAASLCLEEQCEAVTRVCAPRGHLFWGGSPRQAFRFCNSRSVFRRGHFSMFVWWRLGRQVSILQAAESRLALRAWQLAQQDAQAAPTLCVQGCGHVGRADAIAHHEVRPRCPGRPLP